MQTLSEELLLARDASRDLNAELLEAVSDLKTGKIGRVSIATRDGRIIESDGVNMQMAQQKLT